MNKLVISNLLNRPIRSIISVVAIAVEVTLILLIVGLSVGIMNDARERQVGVGADVMVQPPGSSFLAGITGSPVSIKVADKLRTLPHVTAVAPVVMNLNTSGAIEVIYGIDLQSFNTIGAPFRYLAGGPFQGPNDILVDDYFASQKNVKPGDQLELEVTLERALKGIGKFSCVARVAGAVVAEAVILCSVRPVDP